MELERKLTLITDSFCIGVNVNVNDFLVLLEINEIHTVSDTEDKTEYKEVKGATLTLESDEIDKIIEVLKYASHTLKRADRPL